MSDRQPGLDELYCTMPKQASVRELISGAFFMPIFKKGVVPNDHHDYLCLPECVYAARQIPRQYIRIPCTGTKSMIRNKQIERNGVPMIIWIIRFAQVLFHYNINAWLNVRELISGAFYC